jgi:FMN phosphatase YigB (HAD superfamily)
MHIRRYFKNYLNTYQLGYDKSSPKTIKWVLKKIKVKLEEVVMVDDQNFNLVEPKKIGVKTILYKNFPDFEKELIRIL